MTKDSHSKPLIGLTTLHGRPDWVAEKTQNYRNSLEKHGADWVILAADTPTILPDGTTFTPDEKGRLPVEVLDHLDGLVLSGGGDVAPHYFGEEMNGANPKAIDEKRDELELTLSEAAMNKDMPIFAICRGCQVLNVAAGGGMVQHFEGHRSWDKENPNHHGVTLKPNTKIHDILGSEDIMVNTHHHQGLSLGTLADGFVPTGMADPDTWLVESFESDAHTWIIGVQWHPERVATLPEEQGELWMSFVEACRK
ncbi:MAG: gamma-glutamyl-gamma-aminobutyrate hydrolase family protein [Chloroflexota bacterium]